MSNQTFVATWEDDGDMDILNMDLAIAYFSHVYEMKIVGESNRPHSNIHMHTKDVKQINFSQIPKGRMRLLFWLNYNNLKYHANVTLSS